ncbi:ABC-2 transporter permease [candidate division KSB1 bacterium]
MLLKLVMKDLRAFGVYLIFASLILAFNTGAMSQYLHYSWKGYIIMTACQISFILAYTLIQEKGKKAEILSCSLPSDRKSIIRSKYLLMSFVTVYCIFVFLAFAYICLYLFPERLVDPYLISSPYSLLFVLILAFTFVSIYIPLYITFNAIWLLINLALLSILITVLLVYGIHPGFSLENIDISGSGNNYYVIMSILVPVFLYLSYRLSLFIFSRKEL